MTAIKEIMDWIDEEIDKKCYTNLDRIYLSALKQLRFKLIELAKKDKETYWQEDSKNDYENLLKKNQN